MDKIKLIIAREYITKIRTKTFILLTILGPLFYVALMFAPVLIAKTVGSGDKIVAVVDESGLFEGDFIGKKGKVQFAPLKVDRKEVKAKLQSGELEMATIFIPKDIRSSSSDLQIYYTKTPGMSVMQQVESIIEKKLSKIKMQELGIDEETVESINAKVNLHQVKIGEDGEAKGSSTKASAIGFASGFLLYFFIFIYGSLVLRGVQEEKQSRIVEVVISSVKPFQLMMGKIIGNALLGLTQFGIWILLTLLLGTIASIFLASSISPDDISAIASSQGGMMQSPVASQMSGLSISGILEGIPVFKMIFFFFFYFFGGYLLYSSLFAAVAAAVDSQQDLQQFMLPISLPMILAIVVMPSVMEDPNNTLAVVFSIIPFTSPVVMMARMPFDVPWYELLASCALLVVTFVACVALAGKIYKVGLLMYGSKPTWKQLYKWIFYKG